MHPADELHLVRTQLQRLKARETELRLRLIEGDDRVGRRWTATISERGARRLDPARMPLSARADPRTWLAHRSAAVILRPVGHGSAVAPPELRLAT